MRLVFWFAWLHLATLSLLVAGQQAPSLCAGFNTDVSQRRDSYRQTAPGILYQLDRLATIAREDSTMIMRFFAWLWMRIYGNVEKDIEGWQERQSESEEGKD